MNFLNNIPPVVKNLLFINIILYVLSIILNFAMGFDLVEVLGLYNPGSDKFEPYQFVTHMFMHSYIDGRGGIVFFHIFFNMFALWMFGRVLESVWGPRRFFIYFVITGIGAAFLHTFVNWLEIRSMQQAAEVYMANPNPEGFEIFVKDYFPELYKRLFDFITSFSASAGSGAFQMQSVQYVREMLQLQLDIPTVGASGAVFGILLAFGMLFPNTRLMLIFPPIPIKAKYFVIAYGVIELVMGISNRAGDNVAHFAHLGGMIFGFFLIKYWQRQGKGN